MIGQIEGQSASVAGRIVNVIKATTADPVTVRNRISQRSIIGWTSRNGNDKRHTKSFGRQMDATRWIATEEAQIVRGDWVDPPAGNVTFAALYNWWVPRQVWVSSTRENADLATARCDAGFAWGTNRVAQVEHRDEGWTSGTR